MKLLNPDLQILYGRYNTYMAVNDVQVSMLEYTRNHVACEVNSDVYFLITLNVKSILHDELITNILMESNFSKFYRQI